MDLERRILDLAEAEGLLGPGTPDLTLPGRAPGDLRSLCWGPTVDALVEAGLLREEDAVRLALQADAAACRSRPPLDERLETLDRPPREGPGERRLPEWRMPPGERYEVLQLVGEGGMGRVYRARDRVLDRTVALKFIRAFLPAQLERVLREARSQARLDHPHICRVYEVGEAWGMPFIAMQFLEGAPLLEATAALPLEGKLDLVRRVAEAIHAAHREGLIHRDLKPGNILVTVDEPGTLQPHVVDFGLALDLEAPRLTHMGTAVGTPAYMAPEQAAGRLDLVDRRSDVWSLGVILFELLTGGLPFQGESALELLVRVQGEQAPSMGSRKPGLPRDLETIVAACLQKDPGRRYESARALAEDLGRFLDGEPIRARAAGHLERAVLWARRNRAFAFSLGVALLALLLGGGAIAWQRNRARQQAMLALQFTQAVQELELMVTALHTLPRRDAGQGMALVRSRLSTLEREIRKGGNLAQGPGHAALGRGFLLLDAFTKAREHYEKAESLGYHTPEVRLGLGLALSALHQQGMAGAWLLPRDRRELRVKELDTELRPMILSCLKDGAGASLDSDLVPIRLEAAEGRLPEATRALRALLAAKPWITGAWRLLAEIQVADFERQSTQGLAPEVPASCLEALAEARQVLRGDPVLPLLEARVHIVALRRGFDTARLDAAARDQVLAALDQASALDPEREDVLALRAEVEARLGTHEANILAGRSEHLALGIALCEQALERNPGATWARDRLLNLRAVSAYACVTRPENLQDPAAHVAAATEQYRALAALHQGGVLDGIRAFDMAVATWALGLHCQNTNRPAGAALDDAIVYAEKAVAQLPGKGACKGLLASILGSRGNEAEDPRPWRERALKVFDELSAQEPRSPIPLYNKANALNVLASWELDGLGREPGPRVRDAQALFVKVAELTPAMEPLARIGRIQSLLVEARWEGLRGSDPSRLYARIAELARPLPPGKRLSELWPVHLQEARWKSLDGRDPAASLAAFRTLSRELEPRLGKGLILPRAEAALAGAWSLVSRRREADGLLGEAATLLEGLQASSQARQAGLLLARVRLLQSLSSMDPGAALDQADALLIQAESARVVPPDARLLRAALAFRRAGCRQPRTEDWVRSRRAIEDLARQHPCLGLEARAILRDMDR